MAQSTDGPEPEKQLPISTNGSLRACPPAMARVDVPEGAYCIDRFEGSLARFAAPQEPWPGNRRVAGREHELFAVSRGGVKPQGYISGAEAEKVCENAGKRLCTSREWRRACKGSQETRYPYGNEREAGRCNDRFRAFTRHPVVRLFQAAAAPGTPRREMWLPRWMNDPRLHELSHTVALTGELPRCQSDYGTFDMVGNLHEWVSDAEGTFRGGFFMDTYQNGEGCDYVTRAHARTYADYSTGFRCCADVPGGQKALIEDRSR